MSRKWWIVFSIVVVLVLLSAVCVALFIWPFRRGAGNGGLLGLPGRDRGARGVIARVNEEAISQGEFDEAMGRAERQGTSIDPSNLVAVRAGILEELILRHLIEGERKRLGVEISPEEVRRATDRVAREQIGRQFASLAELDRYLRGGGLTFAQLLERTKKEIADDPETVRQQLLHEKILETLVSGKSVTEADVKLLFTRIQASRIMIGAGQERPLQEARQIAEGLRKEIRSAADFAKVAREKSEDELTAKADGKMGGWIEYGAIGNPFDDIAFSLEKGQVSEVFTTPRGAYIVRIDDKRIDLPQDFQQHRETYVKRATEEIREIRWNNWVRGLRDSAQVTIEDPLVEAFQSEQEQDYSRALELYGRAETATPQFKPAIRFRIAMIQYAQGKRDEAVKAFDQVLALADTPLVRLQYGVLLATQEKNTEEALKQFARASEMAPEDPALHHTLAGIYRGLNRPDLAGAEEGITARLVGFEVAGSAAQAPAKAEPSPAPPRAEKAPTPAPRTSGPPRPAPGQRAPTTQPSPPSGPRAPAKAPAQPPPPQPTAPVVGNPEDFPR